MTKDEAIKLWEDIFGEEKWAQDCFGTWIYKDDYAEYEKYRIRPGNEKSYNYAWEIDHIKPRSLFDKEEKADFENNYEPMHYKNNRAKSDNLEFTIGSREYKVVECELCKNHNVLGYGIYDVKKKTRVDWKYTRQALYV